MSNEPEENAFMVGLILGALSFSLMSFMVTSQIKDDDWRKKVIKHGCGQYNPNSGNFEWKDGN